MMAQPQHAAGPKSDWDAQPNDAAPPLAGVRVVELGSFVAAPAATRILADFGAEVIKVESPGTGDELRQWGELIETRDGQGISPWSSGSLEPQLRTYA